MSNDLLERLRQLSAVDRNAFDIYNDLQHKVNDPALSQLFARLSREEAHHMTVEKEILNILQGPEDNETTSS
ncbi:MAG TPA: hypothetical protein PLO93_01390 [Candidatus Omnitrophota bacterium]|nr:hypothetical protein [Candidatus Omnitrophota bacterium]HQL40933.1 hypothetical protein [Candidatus Omnitrophota bacterium]